LHVRYDEIGDDEPTAAAEYAASAPSASTVDPIMATTLRPVAVPRITSVDSLG
jgi:hypothetical protein